MCVFRNLSAVLRTSGQLSSNEEEQNENMITIGAINSIISAAIANPQFYNQLDIDPDFVHDYMILFKNLAIVCALLNMTVAFSVFFMQNKTFRVVLISVVKKLACGVQARERELKEVEKPKENVEIEQDNQNDIALDRELEAMPAERDNQFELALKNINRLHYPKHADNEIRSLQISLRKIIQAEFGMDVESSANQSNMECLQNYADNAL